MRTATAADLDPVVATLTASFHEDPVMRWAFPDPVIRVRRLHTLWSFLAAHVYIPGGVCTTTDDHTAVALWRDPTNPRSDDFRDTHGATFLEAMQGDMERLGALSQVMAAHHPPEDHWYLLAIGVQPAAQGRGLGGALLDHTLRALLPAGMPAYLEATSPRSRTLYQRLGFTDISAFSAEDSPTVWGMWYPSDLARTPPD